MAKKKQEIKISRLKRLKQEIESLKRNESFQMTLGIIFGTMALMMLLSIISYFSQGAADSSLQDGHPLHGVTNDVATNKLGTWGSATSNFLVSECFGVSSLFLVCFIGGFSLSLMHVIKIKVGKLFVRCTIYTFWFSLFLAVIERIFPRDSFFKLGGDIGYNFEIWLQEQLGILGIVIILIAVALIYFVIDIKAFSSKLRRSLRFPIEMKEKHQKQKEEEEIQRNRDIEKENHSESVDISADTDLQDDFSETNEQAKEDENSDYSTSLSANDYDEHSNELETEDVDDLLTEDYSSNDEIENQDETEEDTIELGINEVVPDELVDEIIEPYNPRLDLENYHFPTLDLLKDYGSSIQSISEEEKNSNKDKIIDVLQEFDIKISNISATTGPTVTLYEITPAQGVRISKIRNLEDDIALRLAALGIRIIAPIPGKGTVGIEVPNSNPQIVSMRSIIGSRKFQQDKSMELPMALGKTITNEVFIVDLAKMPHILVAGATGQGKSVGLNAMIVSLLYKKHPAELKFVMVDPKKVEFSIYSIIEKHYLAKLPDEEEPIITDVTKVVQTLNSICVEMDKRYDLLKEAHVRNLKEYNAKFIDRKLNPEKGHRYMPYIVVVIDEFGDLIMTAGKDIELPIARIAQLARAVGIHMIIATQRPTTNIITGTIKANFPARIAFKVSQMTDSRTILDRPGANQLIGRGDMLYLRGMVPVRIQCAFVDTPEVDAVTHFIANQQGYINALLLPEYVDENSDEPNPGEVDMTRLDVLFEDVARVIVIHQQGSTSFIQRKFSIGYNRAGRLMDQLEKAGIVGPMDGQKGRKVLCSNDTELQLRLDALGQFGR